MNASYRKGIATVTTNAQQFVSFATPGRLSPDVTVPEWLYGKMIGGYTPMVPAVGLITVVLGGIILAVGLTINGMLQRRD